MSEAFVPLISGPASSGDTSTFHLKVLPNPGAESGFEPLRQGSGAKTQTPTSPLPSQQACAKNPIITLQREGDAVSGIKIECGCGQVIDLVCCY